MLHTCKCVHTVHGTHIDLCTTHIHAPVHMYITTCVCTTLVHKYTLYICRARSTHMHVLHNKNTVTHVCHTRCTPVCHRHIEVHLCTHIHVHSSAGSEWRHGAPCTQAGAQEGRCTAGGESRWVVTQPAQLQGWLGEAQCSGNPLRAAGGISLSAPGGPLAGGLCALAMPL